MTLDPNGDQIHLWCCFFSAIGDKRLLAEYATLLNDAERIQQQRFHFERDQHRYLVTRALVRTVLARYAPIAPQDWIFSAGAYGRPEIANDDPQARRISFNVSHTNGLIVLAVAHDQALGVDTESLAIRQASIEIADRFFAPSETAALRALPAARQQQRFLEYWTLKESYIKARSMGLSIPLDSFAFALSDDGLQLSIDARENDAPSRWRFWQMQLAPDYLVALCAEWKHPGLPQMIVKNVVPCRSEQDLRVMLLRASEDCRSDQRTLAQ